MKLTKNFSLHEFYKTNYLNYLKENKEFALVHSYSLLLLTWVILEPIRNFYKKPVIITSGIRCSGLNKEIGSSDSSQHLFAEAVDIKIRDIPVKRMWEDLKAGRIIPLKLIGQCIWEKKDGKEWLHIGLNTPRFKAANINKDLQKFFKIHD